MLRGEATGENHVLEVSTASIRPSTNYIELSRPLLRSEINSFLSYDNISVFPNDVIDDPLEPTESSG